MANKLTNTEETKQSTVVLNDDVNPIQDDTTNSGFDTPEDITQDPIQDDTTNSGPDIPEDPTQDDAINPESNTPEEAGNGDTTNPESDTPEEADHGDGDSSNSDHNPTDQGSTGGTDTKPNPGQTPNTPLDNCGPEVAEPWAHDELLQDADGHTGLERELRLHCGVTYNVVKMWLDELKKATDKNAVIDKISWHIPTGGPKSIKVHHKAKIIEALKALK